MLDGGAKLGLSWICSAYEMARTLGACRRVFSLAQCDVNIAHCGPECIVHSSTNIIIHYFRRISEQSPVPFWPLSIVSTSGLLLRLIDS